MSTTLERMQRLHDQELRYVGAVAGFVGLLVGMLLVVTVVRATSGGFDPGCREDEVYGWRGGDYPDAVTWECVPLDDLRLLREVD